MAKLAKRAWSAPLAICRPPIDTERAWPERAISQSEIAAADGASQADLASKNPNPALLKPVDLAGADLRAADLHGAVLDHANFAGASLVYAGLCGASLRFACLETARLDDADLSLADLRHSCLGRADFRGASLCGAQLDYADFSGANLLGADLSGAHLRYAKNLTKAQLDAGRVSESTILPLCLQCEPWIGDRPASRRRPNWIVGASASALAVLAGSLAVQSLVWPLLPFGDTFPLRAQANVAIEQAVAANPTLSIRATVAVHAQASEASDLVGSTPTEPALLEPVSSAPAMAAATPEVSPVTASKSLAAPGAPHAEAGEVLHPLSSPNVVAALKDIPSQSASNSRGPTELSDVSSPSVEAVTTQLAFLREPAVEELARKPRVELEPVVAREPIDAPAKPVAAAFPGFDPLTLVVSLRDQKIDVYRGTSLVTSSKISSGKRGYGTRAGVFSILEKRRHHHSNLYSNAPMPWMHTHGPGLTRPKADSLLLGVERTQC